jgi:phage portal protein BeeE
MSFWSNATRWVRKSNTPDWGVLERYLAWAFGGGASASGIIVNPQTAMQAAAVYSCIKVLAESVGMLPCNLYRKGANNGVTRRRDHPLWPLLHDQPNEYQSSVEFFEMLVMHLCLRGNHYAYVNRTSSGRVVELLPLHPDVVRTEMSSNFQLRYQVTMPDGSFKDLRARRAPARARPHAERLARHLADRLRARSHRPRARHREVRRPALPERRQDGRRPRAPGQDRRRGLQAPEGTFDEAHSGENAHKTAVLEEGMKYTKVTMTGEDAQFLETRKYQRSEIAAHLPRAAAHDRRPGEGHLLQYRAAVARFRHFSLMPWLNRIEKAVKRDLFTREDKKTLRTRFNVALYAARRRGKARGQVYQQGIASGWLTRNEARAMESELGVVLNPLDGLDEPLQPLNMADQQRQHLRLHLRLHQRLAGDGQRLGEAMNLAVILSWILACFRQGDKSIVKAAATMVNAQTVFTIANGPIEILDILSECITANDTTASTMQWQSNPTVGSAPPSPARAPRSPAPPPAPPCASRRPRSRPRR